MTAVLALRVSRGRSGAGVICASILALGLTAPSVLAADAQYGQWPSPQGRRGDYRGDDAYRDPRGAVSRPGFEGQHSPGAAGQPQAPDSRARTYGWDRGAARDEPLGYGSGWGDSGTRAGDSSWPSRAWGTDPHPPPATRTDRGTHRYSPWEPRGERPWARPDRGGGERHSERLVEPPPAPPPPPPLPYGPYGVDPYSGGGYGHPGASEDRWRRY